MLRSVRTSLRNRLRQLWEQCDLFDSLPAPPQRDKTRAKKAVSTPVRQTRVPQTNRDDLAFVERLTEAFHQYNAELFGGELHVVMIRVSRRMKNRLGHYMAATPSGLPAEIAISRRHIRRDTWEEVLHTLVHEMVHQWQDEHRLPIDHGAAFRRKAREVGISARATRRVRPDGG